MHSKWVIRVRIVFTDIDGTLTINRRSYMLALKAVEALRLLVDKGVIVSLVSSNALPIVVGLSRYIGLNGPVVGESGALVYSDEWGIVELTNMSARDVYLDLLEKYGEYVEDSWQNRFRLYEYALKMRGKYLDRAGEIVNEMKRYVESRHEGYTLEYSGYAIHVHAKGVGKGVAVKYILDKLGISSSEALGIGDSAMDVDFIKFLGYRAAVGGSDEELLKYCNIVAESPSGFGLAEIISRVLNGMGDEDSSE
ncbi:Phosphoglycolate phosphatase [Desulfurococcus amylolyticus 1221n]|uniref:Phosphoglycolate phosphatase n=1 Tax=Desulfurococcus amylolyticus (strain DSM 18924 / JCM 16383 / VKM B-2413 / 1221n) TaxID=490899 RepID=B8D5F9_DESA1|nr:phosphoglycolate phosphatase [Desulfurococcus amylolyticus]ACL11340.1 Phosphoglycolate phosphatase [Desulfurococcus amylolyticus 1221n]